MLNRISTDPHICHGRAWIVGTRIPVYIILNPLAAGKTTENILKVYPQLTYEDIQACITYAGKLATEEVYETEVV